KRDCGWASLLRSASPAQDGGDRAEDELDVEPQRPVVDVAKVEAHPVLEVDLVSPRDLPEAGESRPGAQASALPPLVALHLACDGRTRTDEAHVALEHVQELRQLIEAELAKDAADRRHARIAPHLEDGAVHLVLRL